METQLFNEAFERNIRGPLLLAIPYVDGSVNIKLLVTILTGVVMDALKSAPHIWKRSTKDLKIILEYFYANLRR